MCTRVSSGTGGPFTAPPTAHRATRLVSPLERQVNPQTRHCTQCALYVLFTPHPEHWMTFSASRAECGQRAADRVTEDASEPMCGLRKLDSVWTTRGDDTRAEQGRVTNQTNLWSVPRSQPRAPGPSPDSTKLGTSGSTQTRPTRTVTMTVTHSLKVEPTRAGHLALQP